MYNFYLLTYSYSIPLSIHLFLRLPRLLLPNTLWHKKVSIHTASRIDTWLAVARVSRVRVRVNRAMVRVRVKVS